MNHDSTTCQQRLDEINAMDKRLHELMHAPLEAGEGSADEHDSLTEALLCLHNTTMTSLMYHVANDPRNDARH